MQGEFAAQECDECGVHEFVVVRNAEEDEGFVGEFGGEVCARAGGVLFSPYRRSDRPSPRDRR